MKCCGAVLRNSCFGAAVFAGIVGDYLLCRQLA
jgi:hypothetical protein